MPPLQPRTQTLLGRATRHTAHTPGGLKSMDFQPPQWGSARTARTAPRTVGAPPRALKSIISYRIAHFARSPLARCHPDLQSCHISHTTRTAPRTVGAPPGALKSIIFYRIARFACHLWRAATLTFSLARSRTKSRTGKIVRDHSPVRARFFQPHQEK